MRKKAAPHNNLIHFVLFVCVLCTMWCFVWFLHEMVLLLHENLNYCTKRIWYLCKLQNKNFSMVCCTTLWWDGAGKGRGWKTAAIIYCWQQQHVCGRTAQLSDISSGATCVADLDSRALALTKEASGNSCVSVETVLSMHVCTCTRACTHARTHARTHAHTHTHTHIQRHPHIQAFWLYKAYFTQLRTGSS